MLPPLRTIPIAHMRLASNQLHYSRREQSGAASACRPASRRHAALQCCQRAGLRSAHASASFCSTSDSACAHRSHCELTHTRPTALTADTHYCASLSSESICTLTVAQLNSVH
eukprot:13313-Heterococcus_DN1.PRE.2